MSQKSWNEAQVGEEFEPVKYIITGEMVERHAEDVCDHNPWYFEKPPFEEPTGHHATVMPIAHPSIVTGNYVRLYSSKFPSIGVVHTGAEHEFRLPVPVNRWLTIKGRIADRYTKRGKEYVVLEHETVDEHGNVIVRSRDTLLIIQWGGGKNDNQRESN